MAANILTGHRVTGLIAVTCQETVTDRTVRAYAGKPARTVQDRHLSMTSTFNQAAFDQTCQELGCRVYVAANAGLSMTEAVLLYRGQDNIENDFAHGTQPRQNPTPYDRTNFESL